MKRKKLKVRQAVARLNVDILNERAVATAKKTVHYVPAPAPRLWSDEEKTRVLPARLILMGVDVGFARGHENIARWEDAWDSTEPVGGSC